ncbi:MAG: TAXI family TRAP transporter solute-binding subunit [Pseudomonadota bacterium]
MPNALSLVRLTAAIAGFVLVSATGVAAQSEPEAETEVQAPIPPTAIERSDDRIMVIGTAGLTGTYYPAGGALCRLVNKNRDEHGYRCLVEATGGSGINFNRVRAGDLDFGFVQSDVYYRRTLEFEGEVNTKPVAVLSAMSIPLTIIVKADSDIRTFAQLRGRTVNVDSTQETAGFLFDLVLEATGQDGNELGQRLSEPTADVIRAFCDNEIDALAIVAVFPSALVEAIANQCEIRPVAITGSPIEKITRDNPYLQVAAIPAGDPDETEDDVRTLGFGVYLVARADLGDEIIDTLLRATTKNLEDYRRLHPALAQTTKRALTQIGQGVQTHRRVIEFQ